MKQEDYKRQLVIANSLYEMGVDVNLIKQITTVNKVDLENYRKDSAKNIDKKSKQIKTLTYNQIYGIIFIV